MNSNISVTCCEKELSLYNIVIPQSGTINEHFFAYQLRYHLYASFGYELKVVTDEGVPSSCEILVGKTSRTTVNVANNGFTVMATDCKLQFIACDMLGYEAMFDYAINSMFSAVKVRVCVENGFSYTAEASLKIENGTHFATHSYGSMRVMLWNVHGYENAVIRQPYQIEVIKTYKPAVLGIMEATAIYHKDFTPMLEGLGYKWIKTDTGESDYTPLYYLDSEVTLKDWGRILYAGANNSNSKSVSWAVFEDKVSGRLFAVLNTHFMWNAPSLAQGEADATRVSNAHQLIKLKDDIVNKYPNASLIAGGDMNCKLGSNPHNVLLNGKLIPAWEKAGVKNNSVGYHCYSTYSQEHKCFVDWKDVYEGSFVNSIDHAYVTPDTVVKAFSSISSLYCLFTSDHMPLLIEIQP